MCVFCEVAALSLNKDLLSLRGPVHRTEATSSLRGPVHRTDHREAVPEGRLESFQGYTQVIQEASIAKNELETLSTEIESRCSLDGTLGHVVGHVDRGHYQNQRNNPLNRHSSMRSRIHKSELWLLHQKVRHVLQALLNCVDAEQSTLRTPRLQTENIVLPFHEALDISDYPRTSGSAHEWLKQQMRRKFWKFDYAGFLSLHYRAFWRTYKIEEPSRITAHQRAFSEAFIQLLEDRRGFLLDYPNGQRFSIESFKIGRHHVVKRDELALVKPLPTPDSRRNDLVQEEHAQHQTNILPARKSVLDSLLYEPILQVDLSYLLRHSWLHLFKRNQQLGKLSEHDREEAIALAALHATVAALGVDSRSSAGDLDLNHPEVCLEHVLAELRCSLELARANYRKRLDLCSNAGSSVTQRSERNISKLNTYEPPGLGTAPRRDDAARCLTNSHSTVIEHGVHIGQGTEELPRISPSFTMFESHLMGFNFALLAMRRHAERLKQELMQLEQQQRESYLLDQKTSTHESGTFPNFGNWMSRLIGLAG